MGLQLMMKVYAHTFLKWGVLKSIYNTRSLADLYVLLAVRLLRSSVTVSLTHNNFHALSSPRFYTTHSQLRTHTTIDKNGREHGQLLGLLLFFLFYHLSFSTVFRSILQRHTQESHCNFKFLNQKKRYVTNAFKRGREMFDKTIELRDLLVCLAPTYGHMSNVLQHNFTQSKRGVFHYLRTLQQHCLPQTHSSTIEPGC